MVTLVGEVHRGFEPRREIEQRAFDRADHAAQRSLKLIERLSRLRGRDRFDQVRDRFGLHEIDAIVEKRAQRELAGSRQARAGASSPV